mmetsp:Transcript_88504/g.184957  ORF Transcript_88504/g.184957 Transcript_88504/m.184957 type:complete len:232 (+) Transcript_88504:1092-1787(+)
MRSKPMLSSEPCVGRMKRRESCSLQRRHPLGMQSSAGAWSVCCVSWRPPGQVFRPLMCTSGCAIHTSRLLTSRWTSSVKHRRFLTGAPSMERSHEGWVVLTSSSWLGACDRSRPSKVRRSLWRIGLLTASFSPGEEAILEHQLSGQVEGANFPRVTAPPERMGISWWEPGLDGNILFRCTAQATKHTLVQSLWAMRGLRSFRSGWTNRPKKSCILGHRRFLRGQGSWAQRH